MSKTFRFLGAAALAEDEDEAGAAAASVDVAAGGATGVATCGTSRSLAVARTSSARHAWLLGHPSYHTYTNADGHRLCLDSVIVSRNSTFGGVTKQCMLAGGGVGR